MITQSGKKNDPAFIILAKADRILNADNTSCDNS